MVPAAPGGMPAPAPDIANQPPYKVSEILKAYHADNLGVTGVGETIAILIDTVPKSSDLKGFWAGNSLPDLTKNVTQINVNHVHYPPRDIEETLDTEWTSGVAPGAKIRIYASGALDFVSLDKALDRIIEDLGSEPGLHQLSISLGLGETFMPGGASGEADTESGKFLRLQAGGVNIFVSTGDAGSNPQLDGHTSGGPVAGRVPVVRSFRGRGRRHDLAARCRRPHRQRNRLGGGRRRREGLFFDRPEWQQADHLAAGSKRVVPDVSLAADPDTGAYIYYQGATDQIGGTSWSAPVWAGFCALINEARSKKGKPSLPYLNPLIYPLGGTPAFNDITSGTNGAYTAGPGHDLVTGLGTPNVAELLKALTKITFMSGALMRVHIARTVLPALLLGLGWVGLPAGRAAAPGTPGACPGRPPPGAQSFRQWVKLQDALKVITQRLGQNAPIPRNLGVGRMSGPVRMPIIVATLGDSPAAMIARKTEIVQQLRTQIFRHAGTFPAGVL